MFTGPPIILIYPRNDTISVGEATAITCEGTGRGSITYLWETSNINGGQWMNISNSSTTKFLVRNLQQSQQYRCIVSNEAGSTKSDIATVTVLGELLLN